MEHDPEGLAAQRPNTPAMVSLVSGSLAFLGQIVCCVPGFGVVAWVLVPLLTGVALFTGVVGRRQARDTGVGEGLATMGLVLAGLNVLLDLCWAVLLGAGFLGWGLLVALS